MYFCVNTPLDFCTVANLLYPVLDILSGNSVIGSPEQQLGVYGTISVCFFLEAADPWRKLAGSLILNGTKIYNIQLCHRENWEL